MVNKKQKPARNEDVSNWQLAENADNVLHSKIQSYLLAQTFLVAAYATLLTVGGETPVILLAWIMACLVTVLGLSSPGIRGEECSPSWTSLGILFWTSLGI